MIRKRVILIVLMGLWVQNSIAQNSTKELSSETSSESLNNVVSSFYNRMNTGVLGGSDVSPSFHIINGYRFNQRLSAGLGLGYEFFGGDLYVPFFLEGNYNLLKQETTPWLNLMAGYQVPTRNLGVNKGGLTVGGKVGFTYFVHKHVGVSTSIGYRYAYLRDAENWNGWDDFLTIRHVNRFEFRMGVVFK